MRELSVAEQRYQAVLAVISDGETVTDVAARFGVRRQTVHEWLARYEAGGLENLADRSHRPAGCPHQMAAEVEVAVAEMRRAHPGWGPRRITFELDRAGVSPLPLSRRSIGLGQVGVDRSGSPAAAGSALAALGAWRTDGAVADGHRRWVRVGRWDSREGVDRGR